jgi:hypothetical protein
MKTILDHLLPAVNAFAGAGLGASFYVLLKTQPYLINRSYDPRYNASYISRFITGVIGGVILASAIGPTLADRLGSGPGTTLTPGILAILGGYAAEAVEQILQRLVDVLLAIVRGDGSIQVRAKLADAQAERTAAVEALIPELEGTQGDPAKLKETIKKISTTLRRI